MALAFTDWSGYTLNARPSDWTLRGGDSSYGIVREASGQRYLDLLITNTGRNLLTWDLLDTAPGTDEIDVYVVYRRPAVSQGGEFSAQVGVRGSGSASTIEAYILGPRSTQPYPGSEYLRAGRYTNGGNFTILSDYETNTLSDTWYCSRIRISGTLIKIRRWLEGDPEPSTWDNETTDSVISGAGWVGLFGFNDSETHVKAFGVGTNGDPAPTAPVGPGGDEAGDITSAASSTDSWAAQVQSAVSLTSAAAASDQASAIASVNLSIMEAAQATDVTGDAPAAVGSMTDAATGNDTVDALASAAAAVSAGAAAGESWTVQAQVLVNLVEQGAAADEIRRQTESAVTAALEAQSLASDQFIAALDTIASLSDSASVTDAYQAVVLQLASIASGAVASDSFRMLFGLQRAIQEAALADASFSISYAFVNALRSGGLSGDAWALMANLNASLSDVCSVADLMSVRASTTARLTAGAIASSSFAIVNAGVRYLVMGAVILRDALQYRVNTKPALNQSVKIKPGH